jgi:hypothetical protein
MVSRENLTEWTVDARFSLVHHEREPKVTFAFDRDINRPRDIGRAVALYTGPALSDIELGLLEHEARRVLRNTLFGESFPPCDSRRLEFREAPRLAWPLPAPSTDRGLPL